MLEFGACNYDMGANTDDGSCEYDSCTGCLSAAACNYDPGATYPGACEFPTPGLDCAGNCLNDEDGDGVCDADEVEGCTDPSAPNFDEDATDNDGSCEAYVLGCTDQEACNYDGDATVDDGSCEFESCAGCEHHRLATTTPLRSIPVSASLPKKATTAMASASATNAVVAWSKYATTTRSHLRRWKL